MTTPSSDVPASGGRRLLPARELLGLLLILLGAAGVLTALYLLQPVAALAALSAAAAYGGYLLASEPAEEA